MLTATAFLHGLVQEELTQAELEFHDPDYEVILGVLAKEGWSNTVLMESVPGLVSITIPIFNAERFLRETIESVLAQDYRQWELLLADDGSTDSSSAIARDFAHGFRAGCLSEHPGRRNLGVNATRNLGARNSRGEFLAFLDADDIWLPEKLEAHVNAMMQNPEAGFSSAPPNTGTNGTREGNNHKKNDIPPLAPGGQRCIFRPCCLLKAIRWVLTVRRAPAVFCCAAGRLSELAGSKNASPLLPTRSMKTLPYFPNCICRSRFT